MAGWWHGQFGELRRLVAAVFLLFILVTVLQAVTWLHSPAGYLRVTGGASDPVTFVDTELDGSGQWRFTTVTVVSVTNGQRLWTRMSGGTAEEFPIPSASLTSFSEDAAADFSQSERTAWNVAARLTGATAPDGAFVALVLPDSPAEAAGLTGGMVVSRIDDQQVTGASDVTAAVERAGGRAVVGVADGVEFEITPELSDGIWRIGVVVADVVSEPPPAEIAADHVGGPSAGLLFTLAYLDLVTAGDLTGGMTVAGTGTIEETGLVGLVGEADRKASAARVDGASVFFAPEGLVAEIGSPEGLTVVPVLTVDDAVTWLCAHGGEAEGLCDN